MAAAIATDLICWLQLVALGGELAAVEPKRLRYRILRTCARLLRGQRRRRLPIPSTWPWADQITAAFDRIAAIPPSTDDSAQPLTPTTGGPKETTPTAATDGPSPCPGHAANRHQTINAAGPGTQTEPTNH